MGVVGGFCACAEIVGVAMQIWAWLQISNNRACTILLATGLRNLYPAFGRLSLRSYTV